MCEELKTVKWSSTNDAVDGCQRSGILPLENVMSPTCQDNHVLYFSLPIQLPFYTHFVVWSQPFEVTHFRFSFAQRTLSQYCTV